ncbi:T9SS type A sorting domain-containing protein [Wenyingzhuangia aestuarii]|uniref:T9SS type A sorting domain-containing protein n=1 Tax=Wenyingzhuangia aestuarii TaxID=1647582 RepID=UPI00143A53F3|nr:T9SS type A sorting domain-containing protein [Wenyingzhuangia aestuarii]NJB84056.1 hypothetical protein [Wenyingzhuangia aestuarii]
MIKTLLKKAVFSALLLSSVVGFSQEPVVTITSVTSPANITRGQSCTFVVGYTTDKPTTDPDITTTFSFYLRNGNNNIVGGFPSVTIPHTNGVEQTIDVTFTWPTEIAADDLATNGGNGHQIRSSSNLASGLFYELRFFNSGDKTDFDWQTDKSLIYGGDTANIVPNGDINKDGFIGLKVNDIVIVGDDTLSTAGIKGKSTGVRVSGASLLVTDAANYQILSIAGAVVAQGSASNSIDISGLASGIYIYKSIKGNAKFVK